MTIPFKTYLVGGAVRDQLLGRTVTERDWVVVGATPDAMRDLGFEQVGHSFPVFLHPKTKEEYALARQEKKVASGYQGFDFNTAPTITLEEDLLRRDLTVNAMALDDQGKVIDPFDGQKDLQAKILRHVSNAFVEDPVRILRIARFAARFGDFNVAPETNTLMQTIVADGEVDALVPDRVWKEWQRAIMEEHPEKFYQVLAECGALNRIVPELSTHFSAPYPNSLLYQLSEKSQLSSNPLIRFVCLMQALDENRFAALAKRLPLPKEFIALTRCTHRHLNQARQADRLNSHDCYQLLKQLDSYRRSERFEHFLTMIKLLHADASGAIIYLEKALAASQQIDIQSVIPKGASGPEIASAIDNARIKAIEEMLS